MVVTNQKEKRMIGPENYWLWWVSQSHSYPKQTGRLDLSASGEPSFPSNDKIGAAGFEPATSWSQTKRSTRLSHAPFIISIILR